MGNELKTKSELRRAYRIRQLCQELTDAIMRRDYDTADRAWKQLDNLELKKRGKVNAAAAN